MIFTFWRKGNVGEEANRMKGRRDTEKIVCTEGPAFEKDLDLKHGGVKKMQVEGVEMKPDRETRLAVKEVKREDTKRRRKNKDKRDRKEKTR